MNKESVDIVFEVGGQHPQSNSRKKFITSSVTFTAYYTKCSSIIAELSGSSGDKANPIQIPDVLLDVFTTFCITSMVIKSRMMT